MARHKAIAKTNFLYVPPPTVERGQQVVQQAGLRAESPAALTRHGRRAEAVGGSSSSSSTGLVQRLQCRLGGQRDGKGGEDGRRRQSGREAHGLVRLQKACCQTLQTSCLYVTCCTIVNALLLDWWTPCLFLNRMVISDEKRMLVTESFPCVSWIGQIICPISALVDFP